MAKAIEKITDEKNARINDISYDDWNVYRKIQAIKVELSRSELKKSGVNKFANFTYYELGDFLPVLIPLCDIYGICPIISFSEDGESASLKIVNMSEKFAITNELGEKIYQSVTYYSHMKDLTIKGANEMQALGGAQTYMRRYLYTNAFAIVESDSLDSKIGSKVGRPPIIAPAEGERIGEVIIRQCKDAFRLANDATKIETGKKMKELGYNSFGELSLSNNIEHIKELAKTLKVALPSEI